MSGPKSQDERTVLRPLDVGDGLTVALVIPFQPVDSPVRFVVAVMHLKPAPTPADGALTAMLDRSRDDVNLESAGVARLVANRTSMQASGGPWPAFDAARAASSDPASRRAAMVYLAAQTGASLSRDVYLLADDAALGKLLDDVGKRLAGASGNDRSDAALAWQLDLSSLAFLSQALSDSHLPPPLATVLTDYAGEAGRHAGSMEEISKGPANRADLERRLIAENLIYLEDSSPAARVRANDWLALRGKAPAGFDPLGTARQRRDALEKAQSQASATP
jgi:hypothetical protein